MFKYVLLSAVLLVGGCDIPPTCLTSNDEFGEIISKQTTTMRQCYFREPCQDIDTVVYVLKRKDGSVCHSTRLAPVYEIGAKIRGPL